ncbi:MAG: outer membrane protein assembly factor BamA [Pseudomonadota bacterium]
MTLRIAICATLVLGFAMALPARAQVVRDIIIEGIQRVEPETIEAYLTFSRGEQADADQLDESLKVLFQTGLFADITIRRVGEDIVIAVQENALINQVVFEGNDAVEEDRLRPEVRSSPRGFFSRSEVDADTNRLLNLYQRLGRFAATVEPKIIELTDNRVNLIFEINEGDITRIQTINFIGNRAFSDAQLKRRIISKEERFWRFLSRAQQTFDEDRIAADRDVLRDFYTSEGYADVEVTSSNADLLPDKSGFLLTFTIKEGLRYRVGDVQVTSDIVDLPLEGLAEMLETEGGDWYSSTKVDEDIETLIEDLRKKNYPFIDVDVQTELDEGDAYVTFALFDGPPVYVERIDFVGNVRTVDEVIRRQFGVVPGDPLNNALLRQSIDRVRALGYFSRVDPSIETGSAPDKAIITTEVEESSTGSLNFGLGYSTLDGTFGQISLGETNLFGEGLNAAIALRVGRRDYGVDLNFTDNYFMDRELTGSFRVFYDKSRSSGTRLYDLESFGSSVSFAYDLAPHLTQSVGYSIAQQKSKNTRTAANEDLILQPNKSTVSAVSHSLTYDKRDSRVFTTKGYTLSTSQTIAGVGGDIRYYKIGVGGTYYIPLPREAVVRFTTNGGITRAFGGKKLRLSDHYFLGGESLRGFASSGVGPRTAKGVTAGGREFWTASAEYARPLVAGSRTTRLRFFADSGSLRNTQAILPGRTFNKKHSIRSSTGMGLTWLSAVGPINLDYAIPLQKEDYDRTDRFLLSFRSSF